MTFVAVYCTYEKLRRNGLQMAGIACLEWRGSAWQTAEEFIQFLSMGTPTRPVGRIICS